MAKIQDTLAPTEVKASDYKAIFFAGGHGVMWDLPDNKPLQQLTASMYTQGAVVGAVCHGPFLAGKRKTTKRELFSSRKNRGCIYQR